MASCESLNLSAADIWFSDKKIPNFVLLAAKKQVIGKSD
jgi:hypothetical protein